MVEPVGSADTIRYRLLEKIMHKSKYFDLLFAVTPETEMNPEDNPFFSLEGVTKIIIRKTGNLLHPSPAYIILIRGRKRTTIEFEPVTYRTYSWPTFDGFRIEIQQDDKLIPIEIRGLEYLGLKDLKRAPAHK